MKTKRILIITASFGDGHIIAATNLSKGIKEQEPLAEVKIVDLFREAHPKINEILKRMYLKSYSIAPTLYGTLYYSTKKRSTILRNIVGNLIKDRLMYYLDTFKPDVIINTYPILITPYLREVEKEYIQTYTVITDYGAHSQWIDPGITKYFVASEYVKRGLEKLGVDSEKIRVTGIPVSLDFNNKEFNLEKILNKYKINSQGKPIVTILAGSYGVLRDVIEICRQIFTIDPEPFLIVVAGKNQLLESRLKEKTKEFSDKIRVFGYISPLHEIMRISDIIVTKAGGLTVTEILNVGVPMIIYRTAPGQERENTKFLVKNRCAYHAKDPYQLKGMISYLLNNKNVLIKMKEKAQQICKPNGCMDIVKEILEAHDIKINIK